MRDRQPASTSPRPRASCLRAWIDTDGDAAGALETCAPPRAPASHGGSRARRHAGATGCSQGEDQRHPLARPIKSTAARRRGYGGAEAPRAFARCSATTATASTRRAGRLARQTRSWMPIVSLGAQSARPRGEGPPVHDPAFTDSRTFAPPSGRRGLRLFPHRHLTITTPGARALQGRRIDVRDLGSAAAFYRDIVKERLG